MRADGVITVSLAWDCKDLLLLFLFPPPSLYCHLHKKVNNPPTQHPQNTLNITQNRTMLHYLTKNGVWRSQKCYEGYCRGIAVRTDVYDADVSTDNHPQDIFTQTEDEYSKRMTLMQSSRRYNFSSWCLLLELCSNCSYWAAPWGPNTQKIGPKKKYDFQCVWTFLLIIFWFSTQMAIMLILKFKNVIFFPFLND